MMELTTSVLLLANALSLATTAATEIVPTVESPDPSDELNLVIANPHSFETYVRNYFDDVPVLAEIAKCESEFRHYGKSGKLLRGMITPADVGVMQINETYHLKQAKSLGLNIHSVQGNLAYARALYEKEGTQPWQASAKCWGKSAKQLARI